MYVCIRPYMYIYVYIYTCKCIHTYKHTHAQETGEKPRLAGTWAEAILGLGQILAADPRSGVCDFGYPHGSSRYIGPPTVERATFAIALASGPLGPRKTTCRGKCITM